VSYLITTDLAARGLDIPKWIMLFIIICHLKKTNSPIETDVQHVC
jgi:superfamily II DNA/RNA helicase